MENDGKHAITHFETAAFNRSATSPCRKQITEDGGQIKSLNLCQNRPISCAKSKTDYTIQ